MKTNKGSVLTIMLVIVVIILIGILVLFLFKNVSGQLDLTNNKLNSEIISTATPVKPKQVVNVDKNYSNTVNPFITVISPNGGEKLPRGSVQKIRWTINSAPITTKVNIEAYKAGTCKNGGVCSLSRIATGVSGGSFDWVAGSDAYGNRLNYDSYEIVILPSVARNILPGTSASGFSFSEQSKFSVVNILGVKNTYKSGDKITLSFRVAESDNTISSPDNGFGMQGVINYGADPRPIDGKYASSTGLWVFEIFPPTYPGTYNFDYGVYCSWQNSYCKKFSIEGQVQATGTIQLVVIR